MQASSQRVSVASTTMKRLMIALIQLTVMVACTPILYAQELGIAFPLGLGESASIAETDLRLTFADIVRDSRCPEDVTCIVAGEAVVVLDAQSGGKRASLTFKVAPRGNDAQRFKTFNITIVGVEPKPQSDRQIDYSHYVVGVVVKLEPS